MRTDELDFDLPERLIARAPATPRDAARLMVVSRSEPKRTELGEVRMLPDFLQAGDVLVFNTTRVVQARFRGRNMDTGGKVTGLYLDQGPEAHQWRVLLKMRRHRPGVRVEIGEERSGAPVVLTLVRQETDDGVWVVEVDHPEAPEDSDLLEQVGLPPLPPYILSARRHAGEIEDAPEDHDRYQTIYADEPGSVAAPTAGLHFTPELLAALQAKGVQREDVTLHVGRGTFQPVESEILEDHPMHTERCRMDQATFERLQQARAEGRRIIPVGTTSCRTIESFAARKKTGEIETDLLISPGYEWKLTDGLMTNFHLPRSTLLAMVAALLPEGIERLQSLYRLAIDDDFRFFSYGDAMLLLP